ncbi:SH3 domain-containing protein [Leptospira bourretii]|uniref:SH3 domain-containing protein n=1 Tax=Leptospira bourretii TaxID=2484962 RepID=A0A4R9ISD6_9LEPT|nr:SH3 domain-containing protein [Leptospira bourretii]TGK86208.1 SH3 domain-containing protein [Leptospira bourretii]TGK94981.1 SH3 domain-containing protein [Leptospira bourretii]TGL42481.1 SH3 domain-containing protein [Leptospira bourretii]
MSIEIRDLICYTLIVFFFGVCKKDSLERHTDAIDCVTLHNEEISQKTLKVLGLKLDEVEKYLYYVNLQLSEVSLKTRLHSQPEEIHWNLIKEAEGIYREANGAYYLGVKKLESGSRQVWIEKSKNKLFDSDKMIGIIENEPKCLNPIVIATNYELAARSKSGSDYEPSGVYKLVPGFYIINRESVLMRDSPSTLGKIVQKLKKGEIVAVIEIEVNEETIDPFGINHWVKVKSENNRIGYIFGAFVDWKGYFPEQYIIEK